MLATTEVSVRHNGSICFSHTDIEGHEHVQALQKVVAKEEEQLEKGGSTRDVQDVALLDHDHSTSSMADDHSAEAKVNCRVTYTLRTVLFELIGLMSENNLYSIAKIICH